MRYRWSMPAVALTIAGSDPSGGAGIQADLKTFHQAGVYGQAAITLVTVQNTREVARVHMLTADLVVQQIQAVLSDMPPNAAKTGALGSIEIVEAVAASAAAFSFPLVVDPVMISKHGTSLLSADAQAALKRQLLPRAFLLTPNIPEAELLADMEISSDEDMAEAAEKLFDLGCRAVLIKGGHSAGQPIDLLRWSEGIQHFPGERIATRHTHGTGCTYSAAITALLALGQSLPEAISKSRRFIQRAIETAPGLGSGCGPVNHFAELSLS